jgi:hypothetical protein
LRSKEEALKKSEKKQIDRVEENTYDMYGDFKGIIGLALKDIDTFDLSEGKE